MSLFCLKNKYLHRENENWLSPGGETTCYFDFSYPKIFSLARNMYYFYHLKYWILSLNRRCATHHLSSLNPRKCERLFAERSGGCKLPTSPQLRMLGGLTPTPGPLVKGSPTREQLGTLSPGFQRQPHVLPVPQCSPPHPTGKILLRHHLFHKILCNLFSNYFRLTHLTSHPDAVSLSPLEAISSWRAGTTS